jgi:hypothetical protein
MSRRAIVFGVLCLSIASLSARTEVSAAVTPVQTDSIPLTQTNWGPGTSSISSVNPMTFTQFNPSLGTLDAVNLTFTYSALNVVTMKFITPSTTTIQVSTASAADPTHGTQITLNGPSNTPGSNLFTASLPVWTYTRTEGGSTISPSTPVIFSSNPNQVPVGSPFFLTPDQNPTNTSNSITGTLLKTLSDPASLALFQGTGTIGLPANAMAASHFSTSTGNGGATIITEAGVTLSISYSYTPVPEPSSLALLGLGGGGFFMVRRYRRRVATA